MLDSDSLDSEDDIVGRESDPSWPTTGESEEASDPLLESCTATIPLLTHPFLSNISHV